MLNPFITLLAHIIDLYIICILAWTVLSMLIGFKIVNGYQPLVRKVMRVLDQLCEPVLRRIRSILPPIAGLDFSPLVLLLLLDFTRNALFTYFYNW